MDDAQKVLTIEPSDSGSDPLKGRKISRKLLINKLNYLNFQDGSILVHFAHRRYNSKRTLPAYPQPCQKNQLHCLWHRSADLNMVEECIVTGFSLDEGHTMIFVPTENVEIDSNGIRFQLPESCAEFNQRRSPRHVTKRIKVKLLQHGAAFEGVLSDFSVFSFRVATSSPDNIQWLNSDAPVSVILSDGDDIVYSGECAILKRNTAAHDALVLKPVIHQVNRFRAKKFRSKRQCLVPSPNVIFQHPITGKVTNLKVGDISGSGLSVQEEYRQGALLPGLIIPRLEINFANTLSLVCKAQVLYRNQIHENQCTLYKCGLAILDISLQDHIKLLALITQVDDCHTYMSSRIDPEELWEFFFETGFIYPEKYSYLTSAKTRIKQLYQKLYEDNPSLARHFTYRKNGNIVAHIAMMRFYENAWFIHHHAANNAESKKAGVAVLHQISNSANDSHNLASSNMQHVLCYYRPDNKFPNRVFGGIARFLKNPKGCSLDTFAYFIYRRTFSIDCTLDDSWTFAKAQTVDFLELQEYYEAASGGLMISALDLVPERAASTDVVEAYRELGLKREKQVFALRKKGKLKAIYLANIADCGINMSELTSCIKVIVTEAEELETEYFNLALLLLSAKFQQEEVPVLVYPVNYAQRQGLRYDKLYTLWVLNLQYLDHYFRYCEPIFRIS